MLVIGVIPARYGSTRLEGKPLALIHGKPMIQHIYENARRAGTLASVFVATDDERVRKAVAAFGGEAVMTSPDHSCGTERIAEAVRGRDADIVVNIQGDEPLMGPEIIDECVRALDLMEMQRHAQLMYTSCGWFFDDISGIETVQIIAYAARVLQLAQHVFGMEAADIEPAFLETLKQARSNVAVEGDGALIYLDKVRTMEIGLEQVVAHYAISSMFSSFSYET